ncbi:hypothetical protein NW762_009028 [Fusarium torreyae]|uniref:NmrA-like domain-containing protein n=1 Tax=Fusarium torreyae TaxID=1237075 RepID=A0A9W8RXP1_9HYPO|nr:hypothetical protein NW762_009028 [Fusarium torreyae]
MPTIAILGATGIQGGSVVRQLEKSSTWKIRALTRNVESAKAQTLASRGVEVVSADVNYEESLVKAFEGVDAVFAVTTFWDSLVNLGQDGSGQEEFQQLKNLANAARKTTTLNHYILSSLPPAGKASQGKLKVPHFDYKQRAVDWMRETTPDLFCKTSQIWPGWYHTNLTKIPGRFLEIPNTDGAYIWAQPSKQSACLPIAGDIDYNFGVVVKGLLDAGPKAFGKIAICVTDYMPFTDVVKVFGEITGCRAAYAELSDDSIFKLFGIFGAEYAAQLRWSEEFPSWESISPKDVISLEALGVERELVDFASAMEAIKNQII